MRETKTLERTGETPLPESDLVPVALIAVEIGESADRTAHRFGDDVVLDDLGMRSVRADVVRAYFAERAEWKARQEEDTRRRREQLATTSSQPPRGIPAGEGMSAFESLAANDPAYSLPSDEFGRPAPNFLDEELAAGRRAAAEKERRVKQMKDDLS